MADKLDYKKEYKTLYMPGSKPVLIDIPAMDFIMIDGAGDPRHGEYQNAITALYALSFTIKMSKTGNSRPKGYFEYVVPPLESLWWTESEVFDPTGRDAWKWIAMIRQPEFVTQQVFEWAVNECRRKKPDVEVSTARFSSFTEGLCVQVMHTGAYSGEADTVHTMHLFMENNDLKDDTGILRKHHEIYISDPRKTPQKKLKTVLRQPVIKI